jgi:ABC-type sugar transport system permease subunit
LAGFNAADLRRVIAYLQKEIRAARRNIGALKLSNLLQLDRFEEDLNVSRMRLKTPAQRPDPTPEATPLPLIDGQQRNRMHDELTALFALVILNVWQQVGYFTVLAVAGLTQIPAVILEAARIDGARDFALFWRVTLPLLVSAIFIAAGRRSET